MHHPHERITYLLKEEIKELYLTSAIHAFAIALVAIFIPIFLLQQDFSLVEIILYEIIHYFVAAIAAYFAMKYASRNGVKRSMIVSIPYFIVFFLMLYNSVSILEYLNRYIFLFLIALFTAISGAYYWMGWHVEFAKFSEKKSAKQIGVINILSTVMSVAGPLVGALIITTLGFFTLFIIVIVLLCISIVPLFMTKDYHVAMEFNVEKMLHYKELKHALPYIGEGFENMAVAVFWPVLLYMLYINLGSIGGIYALSNALLVLLTYFLSTRMTLLNRRKLLNIGAYTHSLTLMIRVFFKAVYTIFIVQGFGAITWAFLDLPFRSLFYDVSKDRGITRTVLFREIYLNVGRVLSFVMLLILLSFLSRVNALILSIVLSGLFMLSMMRIGRKAATA